METASFSIPPRERLDALDDNGIKALSAEVAQTLFATRPDPDTIRDELARFFRYLAEVRSPVKVFEFVTVHMSPFTQPDEDGYHEDNEQYLTALSGALHSHKDYQHAFKLIADAVADGTIDPKRPPATATLKKKKDDDAPATPAD